VTTTSPTARLRSARLRPAEAVAGFLAAASLFIGVLELLYRPFRLAPIAVILVLVATAMSRDQQRLIALAAAAVGVGFVAGAALQVITHHPLF
jgi:hypothetical protein